MDGFSQRKKAFEEKYLHDQDLNFRIHAKSNYLFGLWAAGLLGYTGREAEKYAQDVLLVEIQKTREENALHKVLTDFEKAKVDVSEHRAQKELEKCWVAARDIVMNQEEF